MAGELPQQGLRLARVERELIAAQLGLLVERSRALEARLLALLDEVTPSHDGEDAPGHPTSRRSATGDSRSR
jgi:hypothetical protein